MYPCSGKWQEGIGNPLAKQIINVQLASAANFLLEIDKFQRFVMQEETNLVVE